MRRGFRPSPANAKKATERRILAKMYRDLQRRRHEALLSGPHGADIKALKAFLRRLAPGPDGITGRQLVDYVSDAAWLLAADDTTRREVMALIDNGLARARELRGLPPMSDALPGAPMGAGDVIRHMLRR